jgi:hypothetical protein
VLVVQIDVVRTEPLREPSSAARTLAALLSVTLGPPPKWETRPNFVAITTWLRRSLSPRLPFPVHSKVILTRDGVVLSFVPSFHSVQPCELL